MDMDPARAKLVLHRLRAEHGAVVNELRAASRHNLKVMEEALEAGSRPSGPDAAVDA